MEAVANQFDQKQNVVLSILFIMLISLTVSSDLFLVFNIAGFTLRFPQLLTIVLGAWCICSTLQKGIIKLPLGSICLLLWTAVIFTTIPNTTFLTRSLGYAFWLILNILLVFAIVYFVNTENKIKLLFKWYILSYVIISIFGIIQFILPIIGLPAPYITQWWDTGVPRVNGFSYEPSYYATYLITGWVVAFYLLFERKSMILSKRLIFCSLAIITLALVLSSSRMGILMMGIWLSRYIFLSIQGFLLGEVKVKYVWIVTSATVSGILLVFALFFSGNTTVLGGTGLGGTPAHSVDLRNDDFQDTMEVFKQNPLYGVSLGGVAPAIGGTYGLHVTDQEVAKDYEGISVFAEVLAASGIIGVIPFILYLFIIIIKPMQLSKQVSELWQRDMLRSMVYSLICLLIILQLNQNILRPYLWFHIALLCAIYGISRRGMKGVEQKQRA